MVVQVNANKCHSHSTYLYAGFKKVKSDALRIDTPMTDQEAKYWRFRHENFRQGRPDLLSEIKKASQTDAPDRQEVDNLKKEVTELRSRLASMSGDIERLTSLLHGVTGTDPLSPAEKKRKISTNGPPIMPLQVNSMQQDTLNEDMLVDNDSQHKGVKYVPGSIAPLKPNNQRYDTLGSVNSADQGFLDDLFGQFDPNEDFAFLDSAVPDDHPSLDPSMLPRVLERPPQEKHTLKPELVKKMHDSLATLPPHMQELFVERLIQTIHHPESFQHQVDAVTTLANAAVEEAKKRIAAEKDGNTKEASDAAKDDITVPLAAATLGAFLTQYGSAMEKNRRSQSDSTHDKHRPSIVPMEG